MRFIIDTDKLEELGITPDVAFYLASLYFGHCITRETLETVCSKGFILYDEVNRGFPVNGRITQEGIDVAESLFLNSEFTQTVNVGGEEHDRFMVLADKLRELYPKGKKAGTNLQWRDSTVMICKRLKALVKKYEVSFTDREAIDATRRYIDSFHGDYRFMQVLRYFLWKDDRVSGEETSQFLSYLQNDDGQDNNEDWNTVLR